MTLPANTGPTPNFESPSIQPNDGEGPGLLFPITLEEINKCFPRNNSAPGPDFSTVNDLKQIPRFKLLKIFNIFLFSRKVPKRFCRARTIFIPKKPAAMDPGDFRPISLTRHCETLFENSCSTTHAKHCNRSRTTWIY
ncbi:hypothetical protein AVEN_205823-1 [Araneus ventricosus]|uniref:Uncharacterized protein n=1 Tax=Araneus ventricosus TaxID=182803 RepID=A0A4Y2E469_ARAVE|nr:hypothetical protein AVEN_205823-1 [Araneus ventricosus]